MFIKQNKILLVGAAGCVVLWLCIYLFVVQKNWSAAAASTHDAEEKQRVWEKNFENGMSRPQAELELASYNDKLKKSFEEIKKIELGTSAVLHLYTVEAAGSGDPKNYLDKLRKLTISKAGDNPAVTLKTELKKEMDIIENITAEGASDVATDLMRVAIVERLLTVCKESGVPWIKRIQHRPPAIVPRQEENQGDESEKEAPKKKPVAEKRDRLVQFPLRVVCTAPERVLARLLFGLQRRSDDTHGYFCIRGFQVAVKDTASGMVDATFSLSVFLNEKYVRELKIPLAHDADEDGKKPEGKEYDSNRY